MLCALTVLMCGLLPLCRGTAALLKLSPSILKSINSNLQDKKKHKGGHATSAPVQVSLGQAHQRLLSPIEDDEEVRNRRKREGRSGTWALKTACPQWLASCGKF